MAKPVSRSSGFPRTHDRVPLRTFPMPRAAGHTRAADGTVLVTPGALRHWPRPAPLSWARAFAGTPRQAHAARRFAAELLSGSRLRDDAVVVLSELFTNSVRHTRSGRPGGLVTVQISRWHRGVRIAVTDAGSGSGPVIRDPAARGEPAETGNGLFMVRCLASELTWHDDVCGRTVCAILGCLPPGHQPGLLPVAAAAAGRP
jgi:serine/threonine-protein kinase RsbW